MGVYVWGILWWYFLAGDGEGSDNDWKCDENDDYGDYDENGDFG